MTRRRWVIVVVLVVVAAALAGGGYYLHREREQNLACKAARADASEAWSRYVAAKRQAQVALERDRPHDVRSQDWLAGVDDKWSAAGAESRATWIGLYIGLAGRGDHSKLLDAAGAFTAEGNEADATLLMDARDRTTRFVEACR